MRLGSLKKASSLVGLCFLGALSLSCETTPDNVPSNEYPYPFGPAAYERITGMNLKLAADLCAQPGSPVTVVGTYAISVKTTTCTSGSCFWTTCSHWEDTFEEKNYPFSTDRDDPRIQSQRIYDQNKTKNCPGGFEVTYPQSPMWVEHKGWSCGNFDFAVLNKDTNESIGSVSDDCVLSLNAAAVADRPARILVRVSDPFAEQDLPIFDTIEITCSVN